jgi:hypothetical protein
VPLVGFGAFGLMREQADHLMMIVFFIVPGALIYLAAARCASFLLGLKVSALSFSNS